MKCCHGTERCFGLGEKHWCAVNTPDALGNALGDVLKAQNEALHLAGQRLYKRLMRHRDRYINAWVAATGVYPTEAVLKEYRTETGFEMQVVLQRLEDKDETLRVYEQVLLQAGLLPRARAILKERKEIK